MIDKSKIRIPDPDFGSDLISIILDLETLRTKILIGDVPPYIFFQLKEIFQILETLGSARIEGNNTTLSEYVEKIIEQSPGRDESQKEIDNINECISFIEKNTNENTKIDRAYISELHKILTKDLTPPPKGEGSKTPGKLRKHNIKIMGSKLKSPDYAVLKDYFDNFIKFINSNYKIQYQLLMVAVAHHRFAYIHPFDNGNGRMGRLLNYTLLIKLGFKVKEGRIINPSSVFYANRNKYYRMLSKADSLKDRDILAWSEYFLRGLKNEIEKIDSLMSVAYVRNNILIPVVNFALDRRLITETEYKILEYLIKKNDMAIKSEELEIFGITGSVRKSRFMARLKERKIIQPVKENGRIYTIRFVNNYLLRGVIKQLEEKGFITEFLNKN